MKRIVKKMYFSRPQELLTDHINQIEKQYNRLNQYSHIEDQINYIIQNLCEENTILNKKLYNVIKLIKVMFYDVFIMHDVGKKNPYFQAFMENEDFKQYKFTNINKYHTQIGAINYIIEMYNKYIFNIRDRNIKNILKEICIGFAYNIYKHHTDLEDLDMNIFLEELIQYYKINKCNFINNENITDDSIKILNKFKHRGKITFSNPYTFYTLNKLNYALLLYLDYTSVYAYNHKEKLPINRIDKNIREEIKSTFYNDSIIHNIYIYKINKNIPLSKLNKLRTEMFLESEENLIKNKNNSNIFYLEAPTGSGKTLISLNLALNLLDNTINKIYEVAPYNNIIEQSMTTVKNKFCKRTVLVNDKQSIFIEESSEGALIDPNFNEALLNYQTLNYPVVLISHVKFFDILFSNKRSKNLMLPLLCNSIIILDEIQSYKNNIWIHIINSLKEFAELLNIKIIIMSATLPKMDKLVEDKGYRIPSLIENRERYFNFFKGRVNYHFELLKINKNAINEVTTIIENIINDKNNKNNRILIECLTIKTCAAFYNALRKYRQRGFYVFQMTGLTNNITRDYIIHKIQEKENDNYINNKIILVGTQCLEAGIDIDMNIGFKDISIIDADEQFCGRIARNFYYVGQVYFFDIDEESNLYKGDYRCEKNLKDKKYRQMFIDKSFDEFYDKAYRWLLKKQSDNYNKYKEMLLKLQYNSIHNETKLINNKTYSFLFCCQYNKEESANELWQKYIDINENYEMLYAEKMIKLSKIRKKIQKYIYNINTYKFKEDIGLKKEYNTYIVPEGYKYFDDVNKDYSVNKNSNINIDMFVKRVQLFI